MLPEADAVLPGQVLVNTGDVTGNGIPRGTIDTITFTIGLVPGEKSVSLENISVVYADAIRTESLIPVEGFRGDPPQGSWGILDVQNEVGSPNNRLEFEERLVIRINPRVSTCSPAVYHDNRPNSFGHTPLHPQDLATSHYQGE